MFFKRFPVFVGGSAVGAVIDYTVTLTATGLLHLQPAVALALAMLISGTVVFFFHLRVTFDYSGGSRFRRFVLFMGWTFLIYLLRALLMLGGLGIGLPLAIALFVAIGMASIINFAFSSAIVFAKGSS